MEFNDGKGQKRLTRRVVIADTENDITDLRNKYPFALQFFKYPPMQDTISLAEFEQFAVDRLKLLRIIERVKLKYVTNTVQYTDALFAEIKKENLVAFIKKTPSEMDAKLIDYQDRRMDHISHFILRLAYCKTEELRRWFLRQEVDLFTFRFVNEFRDGIKRWLAHNELHFETISSDDMKRLRDAFRGKPNCFIAENTDFFRVPFTDVLELVSKRRVFIQKGFAYIKIKDLSVIVSSQYRAHLSQALTLTARALPNVEGDTRLAPLLNSLHVRYIGHDYSSTKPGAGHAISRFELNGLSEKSFPLCMRQLHTALRENHHLRHNGRLQYCLFLKGIGMTLDEVLKFWREEFTKIMDLEKFEKQYAYNFRHSFGKEGKRISYTPYSCVKIIMSSHPSTGDHHGCPFRHTDAALLKQKLHAFKVSPAHVSEIMGMVSQGHYQIACTRYFEATHETEMKTGLAHPNQYFEESYKLSQSGSESGQRPHWKSNTNSSPVTLTNVDSSQLSLTNSSQTNTSTTLESIPPVIGENEDDILEGIMSSLE